MKLRLTIILNFLVLTALCQLGDRYKNELKGPVKECSEMAFTIKIADNKLVAGDYISHWSRGKRIFDTKGRVIEFQTQPDTTTGGFERTSLIYDESGCLKEIKFFRTNGELDRHFIYKCDKGRIVQEIDYNFNFGKKPIRTYTFKYSDNNLTEIDNKGHGDASSSKQLFEYDKNGFLIRKKDFGVYEYENDNSGRPISEFVILKDNSRRKTKEYKYNEQGLISEQTLYVGGQKALTSYYDYTFDDKGNWISKVEFVSESENEKRPELITIRKISYY
jgi:YD repeat-containing protein